MGDSSILENIISRSPRCGGYLKINHQALLKDKFKNSHYLQPKNDSIESFESTHARSQRNKGIEDLSNVKLVPDDDDLDWKSDFMQYMLASTIGCVVLMASKVKSISRDHLELVEYYLTTAKNNSKADLPNINNILKQVSYLKMQCHLKTQLWEFENSVSGYSVSNSKLHYEKIIKQLGESARKRCFVKGSNNSEISTGPKSVHPSVTCFQSHIKHT